MPFEARSTKLMPGSPDSGTQPPYRISGWDFPGGPVFKTLFSQYRGCGFDLGQGTRFYMPQLSV